MPITVIANAMWIGILPLREIIQVPGATTKSGAKAR